MYQRRIQRRKIFAMKRLGMIGADLAALQGFFVIPWQQPVSGLTEDLKGFVLSEAGVRLRALGRLKEAEQPLQASLKIGVSIENWIELLMELTTLASST